LEEIKPNKTTWNHINDPEDNVSKTETKKGKPKLSKDSPTGKAWWKEARGRKNWRKARRKGKTKTKNLVRKDKFRVSQKWPSTVGKEVSKKKKEDAKKGEKSA